MKPISKGDLVMVVSAKRCCGGTRHLGMPFIVKNVGKFNHHCYECGKIREVICADSGTFDVTGLILAFDIRRLKRIDPGNLSQDIPAKEELTA